MKGGGLTHTKSMMLLPEENGNCKSFDVCLLLSQITIARLNGI